MTQRPVTLKNIQKIETYLGTSSYSSVIGLSVPTSYLQGTSTGTSQILFSHDGISFVNRGLRQGNNIQIGYSNDNITISSTGGGSTNPAGLDTQIQYNDSNNFGADSSFTWTGSKGTSILGVSGNIHLTDGKFLLNTSTGASAFEIKSNNTEGGEISFYKGVSSVTIGPSTVTSTYSLILPPADGSSGQVLQTDGSGNLSFVDQSGGGGGGGASPAAPTNSVQFNNSGSFGGSSDFTYTTGTSTLGVSGNINMTLSGVSQTGITINSDNNGAGPKYQGVTVNHSNNSPSAQLINFTDAGAVLLNSTYGSPFSKAILGSNFGPANATTTGSSGGHLALYNENPPSSGGPPIPIPAVDLYVNSDGDGILSLHKRVSNSSGPETLTLNGTSGSIIFRDTKLGVSTTLGISSSQTNNLIFTLPRTSGNPGEVIQTDGNGNLSFVAQSGGSGATNINDLSDALAISDNLYLGNKTSDSNSLTGPQNTAVGLSALYSNTTGTSNTAVGYNAGMSITTGRFNTAFGSGALINETAGLHSTAIGTQSLYNQNDTTSSGNMLNSALGFKAGFGVTTGYQNTFIGACAGSSPGDITGHNITCLGYGSEPSAVGVSNEITLGNQFIETLRCADTTIASLSDARDKNDIRDSTYGLNFLENIRPVEFTWDRRVLTPADENDPKQGKRRVGFIAQELEEAMPNGENDILDLVYKSNPQRLEAKYGNLIPVIVKAIQDLKGEVDTIKEHLNLE